MRELKIRGAYNYKDEFEDIVDFNYNNIEVKKEVLEHISFLEDIEIEVEQIKNVKYVSHEKDNSSISEFYIVFLELTIEIEEVEEVVETEESIIINIVCKDNFEEEVVEEIERRLNNWKGSDNFHTKTHNDLNIDNCDFEILHISSVFYNHNTEKYWVEVDVKYFEKYSNNAEIENIAINLGEY